MPTVKLRLIAEIEAADRAEAERKLDAFRDATMPSLHYGILLTQDAGTGCTDLEHERNVAAERGLPLREHLLSDLRALLADLQAALLVGKLRDNGALEAATADLDEKHLADLIDRLAYCHDWLGLS